MKKSIREVYVPLDNEVVDGVPAPFVEFSEFWNMHSTDEGFIMVYVDEKNRIVK
ncbi:MAG: hypothetical protein K9L62_00550 [Vallitaleaceae bacterium]|nr:hypothetical protein [Vallitaleaceae bacterium]